MTLESIRGIYYLCRTYLIKRETSSWTLCRLYCSSVAFTIAAHHIILAARHDPTIWQEKNGYNNDETRKPSILEESLMNSDRKRHSSCSRLRLLRSRTQPMHGRKFAASSLSASASPWRQREHRKWRWAPTAGEASLKVFVSAAVPAGTKAIHAGPWRLRGCAKMWE